MNTLQLEMLRGKCQGAVSLLQQNHSDRYKDPPQDNIALDYNKTRKMISELIPEAKPLLPPEVTLREVAGGERFSCNTYLEIATFYNQLGEVIGAYLSHTLSNP